MEGMAPKRRTESEWWALLLPPNERGCRFWPRGDTYGKTYWNSKAELAHRVAFLLHNGWLPTGRKQVVMHECDEPRCCEPTHLTVGTQHQNMVDLFARGRGNPRSSWRNHFAKFTPEQVREIRARHAAGESYPSLGRAFGMHPQNIGRICRGDGYKDVA